MIFLLFFSFCFISQSIAATRVRQAGEITPVSVEHSATINNDEAKYGAGRAIDLDLSTHSWAVPGSDGTTWLKLTLGKVFCVQQVIYWYTDNDTPVLIWTCTDTDCSNCVGSWCSSFTLTVSTEGAVSDLSPVSDCKYGDTIKLERVSGDSNFGVPEIAIVGKSVSVNCNEVDSNLNIVVDSSQLPAQHGSDVTYSCPQNSDILDGNVKAVCTDGKISLSPENVSPCKETSTKYSY